MKNILRNNRGFTLLEILVTVGIVGVLSAIAVPAYNQYKNNANETAVKIDVGNSQKAYLAKDAVDGTFCYALSSVGLASAGQSDIYRKADKAFFGFTSASCGGVSTGLKADIKKPDNSTVVTTMAGTCAITSSTFELGGGFEKGDTKVGYYIGNQDAGPKKSTNATASCTGSNAACTGPTSSSACTSAHATCSWSAGGITDVCG